MYLVQAYEICAQAQTQALALRDRLGGPTRLQRHRDKKTDHINIQLCGGTTAVSPQLFPCLTVFLFCFFSLSPFLTAFLSICVSLCLFVLSFSLFVRSL